MKRCHLSNVLWRAVDQRDERHYQITDSLVVGIANMRQCGENADTNESVRDGTGREDRAVVQMMVLEHVVDLTWWHTIRVRPGMSTIDSPCTSAT